MLLALIANTKTLWFVTRATGAVALLLLTAALVLGVGVAVRWSRPRWPRFALRSLHRNLTLLAIVFVCVHVVTTVADGYAPISLVSAFIPFASPYRPLWLSLGTIAFDLLIALVVTSLAARLVSPRLWRTVHWLAYAAWPVALVHAFGTGSDARFGWLAVLGFGSLAAVALAVLARAVLGPGDRIARAGGAAAALLVPVAVVAWYTSGPLDTGWARRAGTPAAILARTHKATSSTRATLLSESPPTSFVSALSGKVSQRAAPDGLVDVRILLMLRGGPRGAARIDLRGEPTGGGVAMTASGVSFVPATTRAAYIGQVTGLAGTRVTAAVRDASGDALQLGFDLKIDQTSGAVAGVVTGAAGGDG